MSTVPVGTAVPQYTVNGTLPRYLWYKAFWHLWSRLKDFKLFYRNGVVAWDGRVAYEFGLASNGRGDGPMYPYTFLYPYNNGYEIVDYITRYATIRWARVSSF